MATLVIKDEGGNVLSSTDVTGGGEFTIHVDNAALLWSGKAIMYFSGNSTYQLDEIVAVACSNVLATCGSNFWTSFKGQHEA